MGFVLGQLVLPSVAMENFGVFFSMVVLNVDVKVGVSSVQREFEVEVTVFGRIDIKFGSK